MKCHTFDKDTFPFYTLNYKTLDISFPCSNLPLRPWPCCVSVITHKVPSSLRGEMFRFQGRFSAGLTPHPSDTDALHLWLVHGQWSWAM